MAISTATRTYRPPRQTPALLAAAVMAAIFGPYLPGLPIRTEQIALYALPASFLLSRGWLPKNYGVPRGVARAWFATILIVLLSIVPMTIGVPAPIASVLRVLDWHILPIAGALSVAVLVYKDRGATRVEENLLWVMAWLLAVNSVIMILPGLVPDGMLNAFWSSGDLTAQGAVADRAASAGRSSGIFNQPSEAGVAYLLGLVAWNSLARRGLAGRRGVVLWIILPIIALGGLWPVSKIFLYGAPVVVAFLVVRSFFEGRISRIAPYVVAGIGVASLAPLLMSSAGLERIASRLLLDREVGLATVTGGRYSSTGSTLQSEIDAVIEASPVVGYGLAAPDMVGALDSQLFASLAISGLVGFALLTVLVGATLLRIRTLPVEKATDGYALLGIFVGSGLGVPVLLLNRVGSMFLVMLTLALWTHPRAPSPKEREVSSLLE